MTYIILGLGLCYVLYLLGTYRKNKKNQESFEQIDKGLLEAINKQGEING